MKTNRFIKRYFLILILSFLIVVLAIIKITYKPNLIQNPVENMVLTPIPTIEINNNEIKNDYPLKNILPYYGESFDIKNYSGPLTLIIKIKIKDQDKITKEMVNLFKKQGISIESHKFDWQD